MDHGVNSDTINISSLSFGQDDIIRRCEFGDDDFIPPTSGLYHSFIKDTDDNQQKNYNCDSTKTTSNKSTSFSFQTIFEFIHGSLVGCTSYLTFT
jgi:hypothetical protein